MIRSKLDRLKEYIQSNTRTGTLENYYAQCAKVLGGTSKSIEYFMKYYKIFPKTTFVTREQNGRKCRSYIIKNPPTPGDRSYCKSVAKKFNVSPDTVRRLCRLCGTNNITVNKFSKRHEMDLKDQVFRAVRDTKSKWTLKSLSEHFDKSEKTISEVLNELQKEAKNIHISKDRISVPKDIAKSDPSVIDVSKLASNHIKFGVCSDEHIGSKYHRSDVLHALFDIWESRGISQVYSCGNIIDGDAPFNQMDLVAHGVEAQTDLFVNSIPVKKGIKYSFITGDDHEGWASQRQGINVGKYIHNKAKEFGRNDIEFLGHMEHDVVYKAKKGQTSIRLLHPGGGSSFSVSYQPQKIVESFNANDAIDMVIIGHYHKMDLCFPKSVIALSAGTTMDQSPFMRKKKLEAHVGGWTIEFDQDENGTIHNFTSTWHPFQSKEYYKKWAYRW